MSEYFFTHAIFQIISIYSLKKIKNLHSMQHLYLAVDDRCFCVPHRNRCLKRKSNLYINETINILVSIRPTLNLCIDMPH